MEPLSIGLKNLHLDNQSNSKTELNDLPKDVKAVIFSYLPVSTIVSSRTVCKEWAVLMLNENIWKAVTLRTFGFQDRPARLQEKLWFDLYKAFSSWCSFDLTAHSPNVEITRNGRTASAEIARDQSSHIPVRGKMSVTEGKHYFGITIDNTTSPTPSLLVAIGIGNNRFPVRANTYVAYGKENGGSGYYSSGYIYELGAEVKTKETKEAKDFRVGDKVAFCLDMDAKTITFYKNFKAMSAPLRVFDEVESEQQEIYPVILLSKGVTISTYYCNQMDFVDD